ncbi:CHRD domain-containing protein [Runella slithyformis]|uniref:CHRD domain containing protein n=1 Tax=Runella slithyformis (strain ATCC 29530 / DSM 19594 / LMG 11500 / NCIMB 11436 / LSU 4) TaxID=761193 RepID=A0A7U3ZQ12_RUNSL|nr:CHRD domain-containing protein [Runella slithyformis]AEI51255.1 CHRD domain containing protein [Runella slithyformis DSM 19594]
MKRLTQTLPVFFALFTVGVMVGCKDEGPHTNPEVKFEATLSGANEVPPVTSSATGRMEGIYNKETRSLTYTITYSGLTPIAGHFHSGNSWETGGVVYDFGRTLTSPISGKWENLNQQQENMLFSGLFYVNLHTALNRSGEIRGQVNMSDFVAWKASRK